jgi:hypothetical protein
VIFGFNALLAFTSANRRNQVANAMDGSRAGKQMWGVEELVSNPNRVGPFGLFADLRFVTAADRDSFVSTMVGFAVGQFAPVAGSWYRTHDCVHDTVGLCPEGTLVVL